MKTRKQMMNGGSIDSYNNFIGDDTDYQEWFVAPLGQSRDSTCLEQSNFETGLAMLGGESDTVRVERYGHWACGWVEQVYIKPGSKAVDIAENIQSQLEEYPVLDEMDYSKREAEDANETWLNCYNNRERLEYVRKNRSQFDFSDFADLMGCIRGQYFNGYASELLY